MWTSRWSAIVDRIRVVRSREDESALLDALASGATPRMLGFVNAHAMNGVAFDREFFESLVNADLLLRDGSGMAILYSSLNRQPGLDMNGTDFIPKLLAAFRGRKVALWGTREPYLGDASRRCEREFGINVISAQNGFEDISVYLQLARVNKPELIVLGMGMPKQERLARELKKEFDDGYVVVCGGAILDFLGGKVRRAPSWVRRAGVEWVYRFVFEPKRLFRRYVLGNPSFVVKLLIWRLRTGGGKQRARES